MSRFEVLRILSENDGFISGEAVSKRLGISRAAVWKAIRHLRQEGYIIASRTNRGYCLMARPQLLNGAEIQSVVADDTIRISCMDSVDSTNTALKKLALSGASEGTVLIADYQSEGRGRLGRSFISQKGKGVYLSMLVKPEQLGDIAGLTCMTAVAVCRSIEKLTDVGLEIKWTNDVLLAQKKICGILTELSAEGESGGIRFVVVGIGVNVSQELSDFPPELRGTACSLYAQLGTILDRNRVAGEIIRCFFEMYRDLKNKREAFMAEYRRRCVTLGSMIEYTRDGKKTHAMALTVDDEGALIIKEKNGEQHALRFGEVSILS
jgi:BirA family biotin operon repressor/biotin-[acetyl-CoA-carboxylase] ligase